VGTNGTTRVTLSLSWVTDSPDITVRGDAALAVPPQSSQGGGSLLKWDWMHPTVNMTLCDWCCKQGSSFYDHTTLFEEQGLLHRDGIPLANRGKSVFANRFVNTVGRVLN